MGGGSTELTYFADGKLRLKNLFNIGTIRLMKNMVTETHWDELRDHLKKQYKSKWPVIAIGSAVTSIKFFTLVNGKRRQNHFPSNLLKDYYKEFQALRLKKEYAFIKCVKTEPMRDCAGVADLYQRNAVGGHRKIYVPKMVSLMVLSKAFTKSSVKGITE